MLTLETDFIMLPKPRGKLSRGRIYHNDPKYLNYKQQLLSRLIGVPERTIEFPYATGFLFGLAPKSGKVPDACDNIVGSILDTLVQAGYLQDDSADLWQGSYVKVIMTQKPYSLFCLSQFQQLHLIVSKINYEYNCVRSNPTLFDSKRHDRSYVKT